MQVAVDKNFHKLNDFDENQIESWWSASRCDWRSKALLSLRIYLNMTWESRLTHSFFQWLNHSMLTVLEVWSYWIEVAATWLFKKYAQFLKERRIRELMSASNCTYRQPSSKYVPPPVPVKLPATVIPSREEKLPRTPVELSTSPRMRLMSELFSSAQPVPPPLEPSSEDSPFELVQGRKRQKTEAVTLSFFWPLPGCGPRADGGW